MSVFFSTGQNENFMFLDQGTQGLGMGGKVGRFGFGIKPDMETLDYHEDTTTFDLPALSGGSTFEIGEQNFSLKLSSLDGDHK